MKKNITQKNILKHFVFIIGIYLAIIIFHNASPIIKNMILSNNEKIILFNKSIILSLIISSLIIIYKNILFRKKAYIWIILLFLLLCNFAEGFFVDFKVYPFIILYVYLLLVTFYIILRTKNRFEISMVYSFSILILAAFVFGLFGLLLLFKYIMIAFAIYIIWYIYRKAKTDKKHIYESLEKLFSSEFTIFNILWILAIFFGAGLYVHSYDEYSHWAYDAKAMIHYSKFGNSQEIMLKTRGYPPIFSVWHYIVSIFGGFSEHNLYVGLNMLISIFLLPAFTYLNKNSIIVKILGVISLVFCCYIFGGVYTYTTLYVDFAISGIFSSLMIVYFISKDQEKNLNKLLYILLIIITLSKTNGFVIAFIFILLVFINELLNSRNNSIKEFINNVFLFLRKNINLIIAVLLSFILWKIYLLIMSRITNDYYGFELLPVGLKGDLKYKFNYNFIMDFVRKIYYSFDKHYIGGLINLTLYQYLLLSFGMMYLIFYKLTNNLKKALTNTLPFVISYIVFFFVTVLSMFVAMSLYEASILASFDRYLNWYNVAILIFNIFLVLRISEKQNFIFKIVFMLYIVLCIPFTTLFSFIVNPVRSQSYNASVERAKKVKIINENTPDDSLIYVIDQKDKDGIMAMWYSRYYSFPRKTNATASAINWKIKTKKNKDDLKDWGFTGEKWAKHLKKFKFDYVFFYSKDYEFFENTKFMYDDYIDAQKYSLFKIEYVNDSVKLLPIK